MPYKESQRSLLTNKGFPVKLFLVETARFSRTVTDFPDEIAFWLRGELMPITLVCDKIRFVQSFIALLGAKNRQN